MAPWSALRSISSSITSRRNGIPITGCSSSAPCWSSWWCLRAAACSGSAMPHGAGSPRSGQEAVERQAMSVIVLATRGLSKRFGALAVANDIDLELAIGERRTIIGPNGAGKTTLVGLLSGILKPDRGTITLLGRDITGERPDRRVKS